MGLLRHLTTPFIAFFALVINPAWAGDDQKTQPPNVTFEVVPSKALYKPNEKIALKLLLINRGESPVMVERFSSLCSSNFFAFIDIKLTDKHGQRLQRGGCAADMFVNEESIAKYVSDVGKSDHWVELKPGDIYGEEGIYEPVPRVGQYKIETRFLPARFNEEQRNSLARKNVTVLSGWIIANPVTITVR